MAVDCGAVGWVNKQLHFAENAAAVRMSETIALLTGENISDYVYSMHVWI